ncbi:hypothetical protein Dimus_037656 [Dionaea muscipula]
MAGSLPGVETARRRRIHHQCSGSSAMGVGGLGHGYTRRPSFCLYTTNHETHLISSSSFQERSPQSKAYLDQNLEPLARRAKQRLDEKLRTPIKSEITRNDSDLSEGSMKFMNGKSMMISELQTEVFGSKRFNFSWAKFGWNRWEQAASSECAVCLEHFRVGETLMNLPCAHKFHSKCLVPWLGDNSHCPCCRNVIFPGN